MVVFAAILVVPKVPPLRTICVFGVMLAEGFNLNSPPEIVVGPVKLHPQESKCRYQFWPCPSITNHTCICCRAGVIAAYCECSCAKGYISTCAASCEGTNRIIKACDI